LFHDAARLSAMVGRGSPGRRIRGSCRPLAAPNRPLRPVAVSEGPHPAPPNASRRASHFQTKTQRHLPFGRRRRPCWRTRARRAGGCASGASRRGCSRRRVITRCAGGRRRRRPVLPRRRPRPEWFHFGDGARGKSERGCESLSFSSHLQVLTQLIIKLMRPSRSGRGCCSPRRAARGKKAAATSARRTLLRRAWRERERERWYIDIISPFNRCIHL
jgi:hypothetical protein